MRALYLGFALAVASYGCSSNNNVEGPSVRPVLDAGTDSGSDAAVDPACKGENGCYKCEPTTSDQILNHCSDNSCSPFDDVKRLPLYNNGNLPPLQ